MKRTKISILISVIVVASLAMGAVAADKPETTKPSEPSAELKLLYKFVGNWLGATIVHKTKRNPNETRETDTLSCVRVLGGRFTMNKTVTSDGHTSIALTTYDVQRKCYRMWVFHSRGFGSEFQGKWNDETKIFTWRSTDKEETAVTRSWYADDNTVKWNSEAKDRDGEVIFRMEGEYKRTKQLPKRKDVPDDKPAEPSAEQKVLDRLLGNWLTTTIVHKSKWHPKETRESGTRSGVHILGGRFTLIRTVGSDGRTGLTLTTYDMQRRCYRMWYFGSRGDAGESQGKWDGDTKTLTWRSDHDNGATSVTTIRYVDENTVTWSTVGKDRDGEIGFQMEGEYTRVKPLPKRKDTPTSRPA